MATRKRTDLTYQTAANELAAILDEIESGSTDIDVLTERVERAAELIRYCRETLSGTELRVKRVVEELELANPAKNARSEAEADVADTDED